jgi:protein CpxP
VKKHIPILMLASLLALATGAFAQQSGDQDASPTQGGNEEGGHKGHGGHGGREGRMDPSQRVKMLSEKLNLTNDQQSKVKDIFTSQQKQMQSLMQDQSMSREDKRSKFEQMRSDTDSQIRAVLTGDQQQKFDAMLKEREQHMGQRHQRGDHRNTGDQGQSQSQPPPQ